MENTRKINQTDAYLFAAELMRGTEGQMTQLKATSDKNDKLDLLNQYLKAVEKRRGSKVRNSQPG